MRAMIASVAVLLAAGSAAAGERTVVMEGLAYVPETVVARVGDTLRFVNKDEVDHNVLVPTRGFAVDLGKQEPGKEAVLRLARAGRFEVECVFHEGMLTTVEVRP
jgi:plastocyanin